MKPLLRLTEDLWIRTNLTSRYCDQSFRSISNCFNSRAASEPGLGLSQFGSELLRICSACFASPWPASTVGKLCEGHPTGTACKSTGANKRGHQDSLWVPVSFPKFLPTSLSWGSSLSHCSCWISLFLQVTNSWERVISASPHPDKPPQGPETSGFQTRTIRQACSASVGRMAAASSSIVSPLM